MSWKPPPHDYMCRFDSRVDDEFLAALSPGGVLDALVTYANSSYPVDLHLRRNLGSYSQSATLFVGLVRLVEVEYSNGRARARTPKAVADGYGFDSRWEAWTAMADVTGWFPAFERFLDLAIPWAGTGRGAVGALIGARRHAPEQKRWPLAQGFSLHFRLETVRRSTYLTLADDLVRAMIPPPFPGSMMAMKTDADAVYIDATGRILISQVVSRRSPDLVWAPVQSVINARLLRAWIDSDGEAIELLGTAVTNRIGLGLLPEWAVVPSASSPVIPTVEIQMGASQTLRERLAAVMERLVSSGLDAADPVEMSEFSLAGSVSPL